MADSPPKRVTRARAAKVAPEVETIGRAKGRPTTKITTAAAKAAAAAPVKPKTVTKRRTKTDEAPSNENEVGGEIGEAKDEPKKAPAKKPVVRKKAKADEVLEETQQDEAPVPVKPSRGRPKKAPAAEAVDGENLENKTTKSSAPKATRGRPKKDATESAKEEPIVEEPAPAVKKAVRTRAGTTSKTTTATRKRVAFNEGESDKENRVPSPPKKEIKATSLRARAVRKPPVPTRTTRRGKAVDEAPIEAERPPPLSPKKVTQVSISSESDDELATRRTTPVKALLKSPVKNPSPVKASKLDFGSSTVDTSTTNAFNSPIKGFGGSVLATPARRPPPSPFKDTLKDSAKKVQLGDSLLGRQPFRVSAAMTAFTPAPAPQAQFKSSLLGTPARRPPQTVGKLHSFKTPMRSASGIAPATEGPQVNAFTLPRPIETESMSSAFRATKSPTHIKVHKMTPPGKFTEDFNESAPLSMFEEGGISSMVAKPLPTPKPKSPLKSAMKSITRATIARPMFSLSPTKETFEQRKVTIQSPRSTPKKQLEEEARPTTTPTEVVPESVKKASFAFQSPATQYPSDEDSDDELILIDLKDHRISSEDFAAPESPTPANSKSLESALEKEVHPRDTEPGVIPPTSNTSMTPLVKQLGGWMGASPDKNVVAYRQAETRGIFSPTVPAPDLQPISKEDPLRVSPVKSSFFEDEMSIRTDPDAATTGMEEAVEEPLDVIESAVSEASQEYGDENAPPEEQIFDLTERPAPIATADACTPTKVFPQRTFHTVSKVPLKPAAEDSPCRPMKRSNSLSGPLSPRKAPLVLASPLVRSKTVASFSPASRTSRSRPSTVLTQDYYTPTKPSSTLEPSTPGTISYQFAATPSRTPRPDLCPTTLKGATVFVDVHTTEGADASSLFVELLSQMGAHCVKTWSWNPRASISQSGVDDEPKRPSTPASQKVGITHVVYKDGGKRTLEKVRWAQGAVSCVGVGWVLE
jgi:hypothetical protein